MSLSDLLTRLSNVRGALVDALGSKGVAVESSATILSCAEAIRNITLSAGAEVTLGYINGNGDFQPITFSGTSAVDSGSAVTLSCYNWDLPVSSGGPSSGESSGGTLLFRPVTSNTSSGAVASGVVAINVSSGWKYVDASVLGCSMNVLSGGLAENATINALMNISSGGWADSTTVSTYGRIIVYNGGMAYGTIVSGYTGGALSSGGSLLISSGGTADHTTINSVGTMNVYDCGTANSTTVNSGGTMTVFSGGTANNVSAWNLTVDHGGCVSNVVIDPNGGEMVLQGNAVSTVLSSVALGTVLRISNGGIASGISAGGNFSLNIASGGSADMVNVSGGSGGHITAHDGRATNLNLENCSFIVSSGASVDNITVGNRANLYVSSGGTATNVTVTSGGTLGYDDGTVIDNVVSSAGAIIS